MKVEHSYNSEKNIWELSVGGELDVLNAADLKKYLNNLIQEKPVSITMDCSSLSYIDSTGIGILISVLKELKKNNESIYIKGLKPHILKIFKITSLDKIFNIEGETGGEGI